MTNDRVRGVVVAHAELARALVSAVESISGVRGALRAVSNEGLGPDELAEIIGEAAGEAETILFVDLAGGSCGLAGLQHVRESRGCAWVAGVNLPMLLDFVFHREMPIATLVPRLVRKGQAGLRAHPSPPAGTD
ncbi:PTS sugar transporter subunit IIA [Candidatus Palauibacter sp.]|uniref:PTS sugar transporter subunit IIA n=1 Tax=Candidatus Palauibacter sp. TaxID=3101350 RepID=UPI003B5AA172